jgi:hypothetical protein
MENNKMFETKRNSIIKVIIIFLIILFANLFVNIPFVSAGRWKYNSVVEDIYYITQSSDDAVAIIDSHYNDDSETITLKSNIYSSMIGLRFDNIDLPSNSTHQYRVVSAYLSLYSDHYPYDAESQKVTIYFESGNNNILTFSDYENLVTRTPSNNYRNWDLDDVHGLNSTSGQWNDSPNIDILITGASGFDSDTICFLLYSDRGVWFRYFNTFDYHASYAPQLHIISHIYEFEEDPPTGYEYSDFVERYRGFDIFNTSGGYFDYRNWDITVVGGGTVQRYNTSGIELISISNLNDAIYMVDTEADSIFSDIENVKIRFDTNGTDTGATQNQLNFAFLFFSEKIGTIFQHTGAVGERCSGVLLRHNADNLTDNIISFALYAENAGAGGVSSGNTIMFDVDDSPFYLDIYWDFPSQDMSIYVYSDSGFTTLLDSLVLNNWNYLLSGGYDYHYAFNTYNTPLQDADVYFGDMMGFIDQDGFVIVDDDDESTFLDLDTIEEVRTWIDNYLSASPEYDKEPWMGDFTLLLVGLSGVIMIPLGFLLFVSSVREGDIIDGLQILVITFFIGIGCIVTWLWA